MRSSDNAPAGQQFLVGSEEAARLLAMSVDSFRRHVAPEIRSICVGRMTRFALSDIHDWVDAHAARRTYRG